MGCDKRSYTVNNAVKAIVVRPIQRALVTRRKNDRDGWKLKSGAARANSTCSKLAGRVISWIEFQMRSTSRPVMSIDARLKAVQSAACPNPSS